MAVQLQRKLLTIDDYRLLLQAGSLSEDDRVELIEGEIIESVSETSAGYDRDVKLPLYARAGIPEAWLVSLADKWIEVHSEPSPVGYLSMRRVLPGALLAPQAFPDAALAASEVLA